MKSDEQEAQDGGGAAAAARQPYCAPRLTQYGAVQALTQTNVSSNMNDKGNGSRSRT